MQQQSERDRRHEVREEVPEEPDMPPGREHEADEELPEEEEADPGIGPEHEGRPPARWRDDEVHQDQHEQTQERRQRDAREPTDVAFAEEALEAPVQDRLVSLIEQAAFERREAPLHLPIACFAILLARLGRALAELVPHSAQTRELLSEERQRLVDRLLVLFDQPQQTGLEHQIRDLEELVEARIGQQLLLQRVGLVLELAQPRDALDLAEHGDAARRAERTQGLELTPLPCELRIAELAALFFWQIARQGADRPLDQRGLPDLRRIAHGRAPRVDEGVSGRFWQAKRNIGAELSRTLPAALRPVCAESLPQRGMQDPARWGTPSR
jgi:hypothetical protein